MRKNSLKHGLVASMCMVFLSVCGGSEGGGGNSVIPAMVDNVPGIGSAELTNPIEITNPRTDISNGASYIISGDTSLLSDGLPVGDISVRVRNTGIQA